MPSQRACEFDGIKRCAHGLFICRECDWDVDERTNAMPDMTYTPTDADFAPGARWLYTSPSGKKFVYKVAKVDGDTVRMVSNDGISDASPSRVHLEREPQAWLMPLRDEDGAA